jgi:threonine/homoserine/homoserine lactone efflux protein
MQYNKEMESVWAILPFAIGSAISPLILTASIFAISEPEQPLAKSLAYFLGAAISITVIGSLIILLNLGAKKVAGQPSMVDTTFQLVGGIALVMFAIRQIVKKPSAKKEKTTKSSSVWEYFLLGIGLMMVNTSTIILYFPAAVVLTHESASNTARISALTVMILFSLIPAAIAPFLLVVLGKRAEPVLHRLSVLVKRYGRIVIAVIFGLIGVGLLYKSLTALIR